MIEREIKTKSSNTMIVVHVLIWLNVIFISYVLKLYNFAPQVLQLFDFGPQVSNFQF